MGKQTIHSDAAKRPSLWRRCLQFRLRTLMLAMLVLPIGLGWLANARSKSQKAWANVEAIEKAGRVSKAFDRNASPWWLQMLGIDLPKDIEEFKITLLAKEEKTQVELLTNLQAFPHLKKLRIICPYRTSTALAPLSCFPCLESLELIGGRNYRKDAQAVNGLPEITKLSQLKCFIDWHGEKHENPGILLEMSQLEEVAFQDCQFDMEWSRLKNLRILSIRGTTSRVIVTKKHRKPQKRFANCEKTILQITALRNLEYLVIEQGDCSDEGLRPLTQLTKLKSLSLESNLITDTGLAVLAEMPSLETLKIKSIDVTQEAIDIWKTKRPELTITKK